MSEERVARSNAEAANALAGAELYQVIFVRDYIQLGFHHSAVAANSDLLLTCLSSVSVRLQPGREVLAAADPISLIDRIDATVNDPRIVAERGIELPLSDGATIVVSLRSADLAGPEAATLKFGDHLWVWRPGDIGTR